MALPTIENAWPIQIVKKRAFQLLASAAVMSLIHFGPGAPHSTRFLPIR
jgi:hypothetical protein